MIIWIASYPKSGNTLLRSILSSLIASDDGALNLKKINLVQNFPQKKFFEDLTDERMNIKEISKHWLGAQKKIIVNKKFKLLKTHNSNCKINENYFTNSELTAGVIYLVRDPRDVVCSASQHFNLSIEETKNILFDKYAQTIARENVSQEITTFLGSWSDNYNNWINFHKNTLLIKFEDLVLKKKETILKVVDFLNKFFPFNISEQKLKNCLETTSFKSMASLEKQDGLKESVSDKEKKIPFFNKGLVGNWKDELSPEIANDIEIKFKKEMTLLGYI